MPRRQVLTDRQRSSLLDLLTDDAALLHHYTLADEDLEQIRRRRQSHNRLGFALQLCAFRYPGRLLSPGEVIPIEVAKFIAAQLGERADDLCRHSSADSTDDLLEDSFPLEHDVRGSSHKQDVHFTTAEVAMAEHTINADHFDSYIQNMGHSGTDDHTTVNISEGFAGTISVLSDPADGEIDNTTVNLPEGWTAVLENDEATGTEDPIFHQYSYTIYNELGTEVGTLTIDTNKVQGVPCFARGTLIRTPNGEILIEDLVPGDLILTRGHGAQVLRWIGSVRLETTRLAAQPKLRPVRIAAGALGQALPVTDLVVSPQHRILIRSRIAQKMFGTDEVLVAARQLLAIPGIDVAEDLDEIEYFHLLFDQHEVVISNGAETESLYPGPQALKALGPAAAEEVFTLFPELRDLDELPIPARMLPNGSQGRRLAERHIRNGRDLQ